MLRVLEGYGFDVQPGNVMAGHGDPIIKAKRHKRRLDT